ncbi:cupin domain-containing protein [Sinorhizobium medicae]|uniref:cupin domain-containing protein n=1 Tax=Sinorhizobium medicae TaxID=110321 RepID=UPI000424675B|nr:cupin domain-containing protein [Sinorhizobium medicae]MBO1944842.1 cupin domain-containing protein [Sinorhizobium medicae]MDX0436450.1 cupin domain-containing protein [Sinorhizobium medicae]MDX0444855.1 cupin domain-containing protein [Sinorhizobium medicae]MDX0462486.1 cupin domain-containing protein [Sinorhizobium medicae]MDX0487151.1 cupin domain-containing protein [Sinorhizobium medicae]
MLKLLATATLVVLTSMTTSIAAQEAHNAKITVVFDKPLPNVPGKSMRGVVVEYGPGGFNPAHTHAKSAFIYATVLEGEIKSKVNGGSTEVFKAGDNWVERPGDHHLVSANASETKSAKLLAVFVVDTIERELTTPDP